MSVPAAWLQASTNELLQLWGETGAHGYLHTQLGDQADAIVLAATMARKHLPAALGDMALTLHQLAYINGIDLGAAVAVQLTTPPNQHQEASRP